MLKRKLHVNPNELNKVLLKELIGINGMKISSGTIYTSAFHLDFNNISVKVYPEAPNRIEKLFIKMDDNILVELQEVIRNEHEVIVECESDLVDDELEFRKVSFNNIKLIMVFSK